MLIHKSKSKRRWLEAYIEAVSFRLIATVEHLQLEQTDRHMRIHTHSQLYSIPRAATPRGIITAISQAPAGVLKDAPLRSVWRCNYINLRYIMQMH